MNFEIIDRAEAPPLPPAPKGRWAQELTDLVQALGPGKVARVDPAGEKPRRIVNNVYRLAGRLGKAVTAWEDDGYVFVALANDDGQVGEAIDPEGFDDDEA
jgi:hypothetical protein